MKLRIGVHVGVSSWSDISQEGLDDGFAEVGIDEGEKFEGSGDAFNLAARLEKCAEEGSTAISEAMLRLICNKLHHRNLIETAKKAWKDNGQIIYVEGFAYRGRVKVKGGLIDVWMRREIAQQEELSDEIND